VTEDHVTTPAWPDLLDHREEGRRLQAIGRIAAGVADEISYPLQRVGDKTRFLREAFASLLALVAQYRELCVDVEAHLGSSITHWARLAERGANLRSLQADIPALLDEALLDLQHTSEVVHAIRTLGDPVPERPVRTDLNRIVKHAVLLAHARVGRVARLETDYGSPLPLACHPGLMTLAIVHLLLDAIDGPEHTPAHRPHLGRMQIATAQDGDTAVLTFALTGFATRSFELRDPATRRGDWDIARTIVEQRHAGKLLDGSAPGHNRAIEIRLPLRAR
jgi:two-component system, NtrC family, sensor kinase